MPSSATSYAEGYSDIQRWLTSWTSRAPFIITSVRTVIKHIGEEERKIEKTERTWKGVLAGRGGNLHNSGCHLPEWRHLRPRGLWFRDTATPTAGSQQQCHLITWHEFTSEWCELNTPITQLIVADEGIRIYVKISSDCYLFSPLSYSRGCLHSYFCSVESETTSMGE